MIHDPSEEDMIGYYVHHHGSGHLRPGHQHLQSAAPTGHRH